PPPPPGNVLTSVAATGGGDISVDAFGDINVGGLALATLSNSSITLDSRAGSVNAGVGQKFQALPLALDPHSSQIQVQYVGSRVSADGSLNIVAKKDIVIGAGITGTIITIHAEAVQEGSGTGSIQGESISVSANTISGNLSATQGINVSG